MNRLAPPQRRQRRSPLDALDMPAHLTLRPRDRPFWDALVHAHPGWKGGERATAADLARVLADIEAAQAALAAACAGDEEPPPPDPAAVRQLQSLTRRALDLGGMLGLHG